MSICYTSLRLLFEGCNNNASESKLTIRNHHDNLRTTLNECLPHAAHDEYINIYRCILNNHEKHAKGCTADAYALHILFVNLLTLPSLLYPSIYSFYTCNVI